MTTAFIDLVFTRNAVDRLGGQRDDAAFVETMMRHPARRYALFAGDQLLLARNGTQPGTQVLVAAEHAERLGSLSEPVLLGRDDEGPLLAASLLEPEAAVDGDDGWERVDLRALATGGLVPPEMLGLLAEASSMTHWHRRHGFCAACGAPTRLAAAGWRRECAACGGQHFPRTDPVVIMLVLRGEDCLLARQPRFAPGVYSCLAGFLEPGETIEDAVRREVMEEAGIRVGAVGYVACQPWPFPSSLMIGCIAQALDDKIVLDRTELEDGRWFAPAEVDLMLDNTHPDGLSAARPAAIARHLLQAHRDGAIQVPGRSTGQAR